MSSPPRQISISMVLAPPACVVPVEKAAEKITPQDRDQGEGEADFEGSAGGYLESPKRKNVEIGQDGDTEAEADVGDGLAKACPARLAPGQFMEMGSH